MSAPIQSAIRRAGWPALLSLPLLVMSGYAGADGAERLDVAPMPSAVEMTVVILPAAPVVDGDLGEWEGIPFQEIPITPTLKQDRKNRVGKQNVELRAGIFDGRFYLAARWPDATKDDSYRPWRWRDGRYKRLEKHDDQFAVRFHMSGDYDACMLGKSSYRVDVWRWSAGRSNPAGMAEDQMHTLSMEPMEDASEFMGPHGMVHILKRSDAGERFFANTPAPKSQGQDEEPGITQQGAGSGSLVDVTAKGIWRDGFWHLEMSRALNTGHEDDAILGQGKIIQGAIAVFDGEGDEHKSVSGTLNFQFPP